MENVATFDKAVQTKLCRPRKNEEKTLGQRQLKEKVIEKCGVGYGFVYFNNKAGFGEYIGIGSVCIQKGHLLQWLTGFGLAIPTMAVYRWSKNPVVV